MRKATKTSARNVLHPGIRPALAKLWPVTLALGSLSFLSGLFIAITGFMPDQSDLEPIINICWAFIFGGGLVLFLITFVVGFAHDLELTVAGRDASQNFVNQGERHYGHKR